MPQRSHAAAEVACSGSGLGSSCAWRGNKTSGANFGAGAGCVRHQSKDSDSEFTSGNCDCRSKNKARGTNTRTRTGFGRRKTKIGPQTAGGCRQKK